MINPELVIFAIESGLRLGGRIRAALISAARDRPLLLPLGDLFGSVTEAEAMRFFAVDQPSLLEPGGSCHELRDDREALVQFYRALRALEDPGEEAGTIREEHRRQLAGQLAALDQFDRAHPASSPARRMFVATVEAGLDYFAACPAAQSRSSAARRVIRALLGGLDTRQFTEPEGPGVLAGLLRSALERLGGSIDAVVTVDLDDRMGGLSDAVADRLRAAAAQGRGAECARAIRRMGPGLLRALEPGGPSSERLSTAGRGELRSRIRETIGQAWDGVVTSPDLFHPPVFESLVRQALPVMAEASADWLRSGGLRLWIKDALALMDGEAWSQLFPRVTALGVMEEIVRLAPREGEGGADSFGNSWPAQCLGWMVSGLRARGTRAGACVRGLSSGQGRRLHRLVLGTTARAPALWLGTRWGGGRRPLLVRALSATARAWRPTGDAAGAGEHFLAWLEIVLEVVARHPGGWTQPSPLHPSVSWLQDVLEQLIDPLSREADPVFGGSFLVPLSAHLLPVVSTNLAPLREGRSGVVRSVVEGVLRLARGPLSGRVDTASVAPLAAELLRLALWGELDPDHEAALERAARQALFSLRPAPIIQNDVYRES